jgi:hypothetical protein
MNRDPSPPKRIIKYFLLLIVLVFVLIFGNMIYKNFKFRITGTNPAVSKVSVASPFFKVDFNKSLSSSIGVSSNPNIIKAYKVQGKEINITLTIPLNSSQTYAISIKNIYDTSGQHIADQRFVFTPRSVGTTPLSQDQSQALLNQQVQYSQSVENNALLQLLPFVGPNFEYRVDYGSQGAQTVIEITAANANAQQDAVAWIKNQGFDPSTLDIQYITGQP